MSRHDDQISLKDMRDHAMEAVALIESENKQDFARNRVLQLALARLVEIIGEAAYRLSTETRESHPDIPWAKIMGMRNRIAHGYDVLDINLLFNTAAANLPDIVSALNKILGDE